MKYKKNTRKNKKNKYKNKHGYTYKNKKNKTMRVSMDKNIIKHVSKKHIKIFFT
jgi:hypothetical protein